MQTWQNIHYSDFRFEFQPDLSGEIAITYTFRGNPYVIKTKLANIRSIIKGWKDNESVFMAVFGDLVLSVPVAMLRLFLKENINDRVV